MPQRGHCSMVGCSHSIRNSFPLLILRSDGVPGCGLEIRVPFLFMIRATFVAEFHLSQHRRVARFSAQSKSAHEHDWSLLFAPAGGWVELAGRSERFAARDCRL